MDILSTLKSEYSRTLILIVIPGVVALQPFCLMLLEYYNIEMTKIKDYLIVGTFSYLFASILIGFIIQDIGARLEILLDRKYCKWNNIKYSIFTTRFQKYLFNKKEEDYIIIHYYRSMLVRLKFELHLVISILVLWLGMVFRACLTENFVFDWKRTIVFIIISLAILIYQLIEAYRGVEFLHFFRGRLNRKFKPVI
jgi:hypothetical protein